MKLIFSELENGRKEKRDSHKVVSLLFIFSQTGNLKILDESRRTICFTKSLVILSAILKIYFWG